MEIETTTKQTRDSIEPENAWMYDKLIVNLSFEQRVLLDNIVLSANIQGYKKAMDYAISKIGK